MDSPTKTRSRIQLREVRGLSADVEIGEMTDPNTSKNNLSAAAIASSGDSSALPNEPSSTREHSKKFYHLSDSSEHPAVYRILREIILFFHSVKCCSDRRPCMSGAEEVLAGNYSASESVKFCNAKPPQYLWYMLSGSLCDIFQFGIDYFFHRALNVEDPSTCWALSFTTSISIRHSFHRVSRFLPWTLLLQKPSYGGSSLLENKCFLYISLYLRLVLIFLLSTSK